MTMMPGDWHAPTSPTSNPTYAYARLPVVCVYEGNRHILPRQRRISARHIQERRDAGATAVLAAAAKTFTRGAFRRRSARRDQDAPIKIQPGYTVVVTSGASRPDCIGRILTGKSIRSTMCHRQHFTKF
jgi:hypothetical protein